MFSLLFMAHVAYWTTCLKSHIGGIYCIQIAPDVFLITERLTKLISLQIRVSCQCVCVLLQWSGDNHGGQSALHPAAALHCWRAPVAHHHWCHLCGRLRWVCTVHICHITRDVADMFYVWPIFLRAILLSSQTVANLDLSYILLHPSLASFLSLCVSQVSFTATGSTVLWAGSQAPTPPFLISVSTQTSAFTLSSAKRGSSSVRCPPLPYL